MTPVNVIIDTDVGDDVDDALAIAFAMMRPEIRVRAITTVFGPTHRRLAIVSKLVGIIARELGLSADQLPMMAAGLGTPLTCMSTERLRRILDETPNQYPFADDVSPSSDDAVALYGKLLGESNGDIVLITIGAMTNVGSLVRSRPDLARRLRMISIMGGSYARGVEEHNVKCDPLAARIVFRSDAPKAQFTMEVAGKVVLRAPEMAELRAASGAIPRALCRLIDLWWPHKGDKPGPVLYDLSPILWLFRPDIYSVEPWSVDVITEDGPELGRTIWACGPVTTTATEMDADAATRLFLDTICSR